MEKLNPKNIENILPLTPVQEGILFHYLKNPGSDFYFEQLSLNINGEIEVPHFEKAWRIVVETNEMLRTVFRWEKLAKPSQIILKEHQCRLNFYNLAAENNHEKKTKLAKIKDNDRHDNFDLHGVPFRVILCKLAENKYRLIISNHHILYDGWSTGIILKEFFKAYHGLCRGERSMGFPMKTPFKEFIKWIQSRDGHKQEQFWRNYLAGFETPAVLPIKRKIKTTGGAGDHSIILAEDLKDKLNVFIKKRRITLASVFYTAWGILLQKYGDNEDVVFGTTVSGRSGEIKGIEDMVGLFIDTIPLRIRVTSYEKLHDAVFKTEKILREREPFENTPLVDIGSYSGLGNNESLFDTILAIENYPLDNHLVPVKCSLSIDSYSMNETTHYDLTVGILPFNEITINFNYKPELFAKETIENLAGHFKRIMQTIIENPETVLSQLEIISAEEKNRILYVFNHTAQEYPANKTIRQLFSGQVEKTPDRIAVVGAAGGEEKRAGMHLSYGELNERSNKLAGLLIEKGTRPDNIVGIMAERFVETVVGIMGILKSGGAYLAIEPQYPQERIDYMVADSNTKIIIGNGHACSEKLNCQLLIVNYEWLMSAPQASFRHSPFISHHSNPLAYVIYTSGSTGTPKGVLVTQRSVIRLIKNTNYIEFRERDRILQGGAISFDASTFEIWGALLNGPALVLLPKEYILNPILLKKAMQVFDISIAWMTSPLFNRMMDEDEEIFAGLRCLLVGGDKLSPMHVNRVRRRFPGLNINNGYGPTENTTFSTIFRIDREYTENIPVGKPIANSTAYIVDKYNNLSPIGVPGELFVGGDGVAGGYLNNPELTAEKFGFFLLSSRLYKTGDRACWLPDGNIEFLGRIDQQVKIRGFRIEPGEIENQLLKHGEIKDAFILAKEDITGDKYLAAYFVSDKALPDAELREHLLKDLPDYMVPSYFVRLEKMPLTPSGKVDRKALPDLDLKTGEAYVAPRDEMEKKLVEIWTTILSRNGSQNPQNPQNPIGIDDNFFRLGGHSLKATSLVSLVHKTLNVKIPLEEIFKRPTIRRLSDYINKAVTERFILIKPVEKKEYYALSSAQKRLYFLQQMDNAGTVYNMPSTWLLEGVPDKSHLENVFMKLIKRHESLRTSFDVIGEEPIQRIYRDATFEIEYNDLTTGVQDHLSSFIHHFVRAFDLSQAPLLRAGLVKIAAEKYVLAVDMHHIISDGTSMNIIIKDFMALYRREDLPELRVQYKDFSAWQGREKQGELIKRQEDYWVNELAGEIPVLELPADYPRPPVQDFAGSSIHFEIDKQATAVLKRLALENDVTVYMILLAIYNVFLAKITNREDIVVGSPIAGRRHADLEKIIGMFVNTLALRNYVSTEKTFTGFLYDVKEKTLSAFENQDYPFEDLVERVVKNRDTSRNPVFDVMFVLQNMGMPEIVLEGLILKPYDYENKTAKFDLNLTGWEKEGKLSFDLEYSTKLFKKETALRLSGYFKNCIDAVRINPGAPIAGIEIMSKAEKEKILAISNGITEPFDFTETIHGMFEKIALGNEDKTALVFKNARLTYGEFNRKADRLGWMLRQKGIGRDSVAGLMAERSFELVIGMVGIMKAGGAFLPIDPKLPNQRKRFMCEDSRMAVLLTNFKVENDIPGNIEIIDIRDEGGAKEENITAITPINQGADLAYVIFTSGSTGNPKGVMLEHSNLVNLIRFHHRCTGIDCRKVMQFATISFDASFHEIFSALLAGGELYLIDEETRNNIPSLLKYIGKNKIKTLFLPMAFLKIIFNDDDYVNTFPHCVEHIQTAGEQVVVSGKFKKYLQENNIYLHNHYGPSETHVITAFTVNPREDIPEFPSIGKPVMNTGIYILDKAKQLLPMGVAGELYAGGLQVGRGYLNNPELTDEKLKIKNEKLKIKNEKLYRTGDLARWLEDGNIEFLGRIDQQVKIRGIRVEPGEIESRLKKIALIKDAVVVVKQDASGEKYLCAYIVLSTGTDCNERELRNTLAIHLPEYMVPAYFVQLEKMPLTPSGKIDRKALPEPQVKTGESYTGPRNEIEKKLAAIWAEVLGQGTVSIGIDDNFFQLGGNSLKAIILLSKIHKVFEVKIPLPELFKHPRIRELAGYLKNAGSWKYESIEWVEKKEYYALSSAQKRLFFLQQIDAESTAYNLSSIMVFEGLVDKDKLAGAVAKLIRRHESFRTSFVIIDEEPVQRIHDEVEFEIDRSFAELFQKRLPEGPPEAIITSFIRPFDLAKAPLLRVGLVKLAETHLFLVDMHHIISDGMSIQVLIQDFSNLYAGLALPGINLQYKDYAEWQNREKTGKKISEQKAYWQKEYEEEIPVLELPTDYARPAVRDFAGDNINFAIDGKTYSALKALVTETGTTLYMVLSALYAILVAKLGSREDMVIGSPVAGRKHDDLEKIIGMFVNMLALRYRPLGEKKFVYFLQEVKEKALRAFENQEYPYEDLVEILAVPRDLGRNPLFDTIFTLQNTGSQQIEIPGLKLVPGEFENKTAKFDLSLTAVEKDEKLLFTFEYSTKLFKRETIERFIVYYKKIIESIIENKNREISDLEILTAEERKRVLYEFNDTEAVYPRDKTIHGLLMEQAEKAPDRIAVIGSMQQITYHTLDEQSNKLAKLLIDKGILSETIVGIMIERSPGMIISIYGILKAGGVYMPVDPGYPQERIDYMLKNSAARFLLYKSETNQDHSNKSFENLLILDFKHPHSNFGFHAVNLNSANLAYIMYTSGSTGKPKGVMITHRNVVRLVINTNFVILNEDTRILQTGSPVFDATTFEIWGSLLNGGQLVLVDNEVILNARRLALILANHHINTLWLTVTLFNQFIQQDIELFAPIRYLLVGGEVLSPVYINHVREKFPGLKVINGYGPTENTTFSTSFLIETKFEYNIPIGRPIANSTAYILDKRNRLTPIGIVGELYVGGDGVARGYLNNPELTSEKFRPLMGAINKTNINKSFAGVTYKTGDLARWLEDGNIEFMGRSDYQVKIRGFRIELEEIENRLLKHHDIKNAVVIERVDKTGEKYLCAYIVFQNSNNTDPRELKFYLSQTLPAYMIPAYFIKLESIPLNPNGKVDRKTLPEPGARLGSEYAAPSTDNEKEIAEIWKRVLGLEKISIDANFFDAGGNSLKIIKLAFELKKHLGIEIPMAKMFQYPTIAAQAAYFIRTNENKKEETRAIVDFEADKVKSRLKQKRDKIRL